jgi:MATE family multidrug resistance protein
VWQGWFLGMQNARYPLYITIIVNVLNIGFNLLFVKYYGMKADGIAWGTVIAQYGGVLVAILLFLLKYRPYARKYSFQEVIDKTALQKFFTVNRDIFIRTLCLIFTFAFFTAKGAEFGEVILAANTILMTLWMMLAYGVDGFAFAAESLVGNYVGKLSNQPGLYDEYKKTIWWLFYWAAALSALVSLVYGFFGTQILRLFTDQVPVIETAKIFLLWIIIAPVINSVCFIWDGIYIGATRTQAMRNAMLVCTFLVFLPVYYATKGVLGNHGLWLAMLVFMIARGITLSVLARKNIFHYPKTASV